jgi:HEPN domain-containing protein
MCRSKLSEVLEEVIKAELIRLDSFLEKTHDLERLLGELRARRSGIVSLAEPLCATLAEVYFTERYPGFDLDDPD